MKEYIKWFKIYTEQEKKHFYKVFIFDDYEKMYRFCDKTAMEELGDDYKGLCHSWTIELRYQDGKVETSDDVGFIALHTDNLSSGTISHECTHATTYYFDKFKKNKDIFSDEEANEEFAWMQGFLVNQLVEKLYKYNLV